MQCGSEIQTHRFPAADREEKAAAIPEGTRKICFLEPNFQSDELREMCNKAAVKAELVLGLFRSVEGSVPVCSHQQPGGCPGAGKSPQRGIQGKGGGQPSMVQGTLMAGRRGN